MSIFDKFIRRKKKEAPEKRKEKEVLEKRIEQPLKEAPQPFKEPEKARRARRRKSEIAFKVLKSPYITEKSTDLGRQGYYTFKVFENANKMEIKKAVEQLYGVDVKKVSIIRKPSKKKRLGRREGKKPGFKKAVIKLKKGQTIDVFPS